MSERRAYSDAVKRKAVDRVLSGRVTISEYAEDKGMSDSVVRHWCHDPRYGGRDDAFRRNGAGAVNGGLPTKPKQPARRAKALVPVTFACPHCGGLVDVGGQP